MSQGRKRGYAGIIATQRLSKLHKDAAGEANNVIIGRTWLDADQARAGDALGLSKIDRLKLRDLDQGEFSLAVRRLVGQELCVFAGTGPHHPSTPRRTLRSNTSSISLCWGAA
jgi:DNA helicase HerA-like ATPase